LRWGGQVNLPSAEELQKALSDAETDLFIGRGVISDELLTAGWFLYSVASARKSLELYSAPRQRRAYQLSSHIFDLATQNGIEDINQELSLTFAAQVGFLKGDLNPNATAVYRRLNERDSTIEINDENLALKVGVMFLAMDRQRLFRVLPYLREKLATFNTGSEGRLGLLSLLLDSCWSLLLYVSYGDNGAYQDALTSLESVVRSDVALEDIDLRWVAAHLLDAASDFGDSSVWAMLPPDVPPEAARAMTLGNPAVLSLWPPQVQLIKSEDANNPLLLGTKRLFLSIPTSAGKTLLAQYISLAHLAQDGGGICFVAPTHSLCREIRKSLSDRLRLLKQEVAEEAPIGIWNMFDDDIEIDDTTSTSVEVITPERLAFMLRHKPKETLEKFKLFIVDEAHLISEESRGLGLESTLSLLHQLTKDKDHRIILMSSSLGNSSQVVDWLGVDGKNRSFHSEWRGPRRLYALYTADRSNEEEREAISHTHAGVTETHFKYQMDGVIRMKLADTPQIKEVVIARDVGVSYTRPGQGSSYRRDSSKSTPFYKMLVPLIKNIAESGPVLVIMPTRVLAQNLTRAIADSIEPVAETESIVQLAEARVGSEHLITKVLRKGIAFHHAALPIDLQIAIEQGVKAGVINILISTTTLADGVNLPVKSIVIGATGSYGPNGFNDYISGATLVNAIGRAGRAGKESEGWIILADQQYDQAHFDRIESANPSEGGLVSRLVSEAALISLARLEELLAEDQDALLALEDAYSKDFVSYIWVVANTLLETNDRVGVEDVDSFLESTLAWHQMDQDLRTRWRQVAHESFALYESTDREKRKRWAQSGISLASANKLEELSLEILGNFLSVATVAEESPSVEDAAELLLTVRTLDILFALKEAPRTTFRTSRYAQSAPIDVNHRQLLMDWMSGADLPELVEGHLSQIQDKEYAYEVLGDYITSVLQHYLPWMLGILTTWANEFPQEITEGRALISPQVASFVRYGVNIPSALELMMNGVVSRQLAMRVGTTFQETAAPDLESWLKAMKISQFVDSFDAGEVEVRELLSYLRPKDSNLLANFISGEEVELDYRIRSDTELNGEVSFRYLDGEGIMHRVGVEQAGTMMCDMPLSLYLDVEDIIQSGLPYKAVLFEKRSDVYGVKLKLQTFLEDREVAVDDFGEINS